MRGDRYKTRIDRDKWIRLTSDCQAHYGGYTEEHYRRDLDTSAGMKGKFLFTTYPSDTPNRTAG